MIDSKENIKFDLGIKGLKTKSFAIQYQNGKLAYWHGTHKFRSRSVPF